MLSTTLAEAVDAAPSWPGVRAPGPGLLLWRPAQARRGVCGERVGPGRDGGRTVRRGRGRGGGWTTMAADALVDHLEATHHRYLWDELPRVTALVDKIVSVHGAVIPSSPRWRLLRQAAGGSGTAPAQGGARAVPDDPRAGDLDRHAVVPLRVAAQPDLGDAERTRRGRRAARSAPPADRRVHAAGGRLRHLRSLLRGDGRDRGRHPSAHPQGEQRAVPDGRPSGSRAYSAVHG